MCTLTIVANIYAKPEKVDFVKGELAKLIPTTLCENGCINYVLHQYNDNPAHFMFYEEWASREHWEAHMSAPHLAAFIAATEGALEEFNLAEMTQVDCSQFLGSNESKKYKT